MIIYYGDSLYVLKKKKKQQSTYVPVETDWFYVNWHVFIMFNDDDDPLFPKKTSVLKRITFSDSHKKIMSTSETV